MIRKERFATEGFFEDRDHVGLILVIVRRQLDSVLIFDKLVNAATSEVDREWIDTPSVCRGLVHTLYEFQMLGIGDPSVQQNAVFPGRHVEGAIVRVDEIPHF